jgi:hypothetical protein
MRVTLGRSVTVLIISLSSCMAACETMTEPTDVLAPGVWGGVGIQIRVTPTGATVDFDCDSGVIDQQLVLDRFGSFSASGTYAFGQGGPREPGGPPVTPRLAHYNGTTDGTTMNLVVFLPELSRTIGKFKLQVGRQGTLDRCL